jgi:hypothetical protein
MELQVLQRLQPSADAGVARMVEMALSPYTRHAHGMCMACALHAQHDVHGMCTACARHVHGMCICTAYTLHIQAWPTW